MAEELLAPPPAEKPDDYDPKEDFLRLIGEGLTIAWAARVVGVHRVTPWRWRQDPEFAARWDEAVKSRRDRLEEEAIRRALNGSDKVLLFLLERTDPKYAPPSQKVELGNKDGEPFQVDDTTASAKLAAILAAAAARKQAEDDVSDLV